MDYPRMAALKTELESKGSILFIVSIHPGARTTGIQSIFENGVIKINIAKPADRGKANKEVIRLLADLFSVPQAYVDIVHGEHSRLKTMRIQKSVN